MKIRSKRAFFLILALVAVSLTLCPELARITGQTGFEAFAVTPLKYDFGTATSPVEPGYSRVCWSTAYTNGSYGWTNTYPMEDADRGTPADNLKRDMCYSTDPVIFRTDIANGDYQVDYLMGDASYAHDNMNIKANGITKVSGINSGLNQFTAGSFTVTVTAGNLQLEFSDSGGVDPCWVINSIVLTPIVIKKYDFGTSTSPVEPGYDQVYRGTSYTAGSYGWTNTYYMEDADRSTPADNLKRDLCFSRQPAIFRTDIANGLYLVEYTMGDATYAHDNMIIKANGVVKASGINTSIGQFLTGSFEVLVTTGNLQLEFSDAGGVDPSWVINSIVLRPDIAPLATVTVSSTCPGYTSSGAVDGVVDGYPNDNSKEWASYNEKANAWLQLNWSTYRTIRKVRIYDRINGNDWVTAYTLSWNGGLESEIVPLPNMSQTSPPAEITPTPIPSSPWLKFKVDSVSTYTNASGLAEIEVFE